MKGLIFRLVLPVLLIAGTATLLSAQCVDGNCRNGFGTYNFSNGDRYVGNWSSGQPHGTGTYYFHSQEWYEGQFRMGTFEGQGTMHYPDGAYYSGAWKKNLKNGFGKLVQPNGSIAQGNWTNGKLTTTSSAAAATVPATNASTRPTNNNSRPTTNTSTASASNAASANRNDIAGLRNCSTGYCRSGKGYYDYPDGSRWIGEFKDGLPYGEGTCYYANGDRYVGAWQHNAPYGEGVMYFKNKRAYGAVWVNGKPIKELDSHESLPDEPVRMENTSNVKIWAVIVGVGRYTSMPSLKFTDDDAYRFYSFLKSPEGGALPDNQIAILIDESATRENILRTMRQQFLRADANDVVLLYFSGHGLDGCFLPVDFDGYNNKLRHEEVKSIFLESKAKHKLCIADACHSGSLNYGLAAKGAPASLSRYYQAFEESDGGIALLMSSKAEELSLEDHGLRQGVFTYYLLRGLKGQADADGDHIVTVREIYNYVKPKVRTYTAGQQTPTLTGVYDDDMPVALKRY
ncbi:MAG: caspase family protein [Saprospiraceae bacterium]|jgi:hypothetical protein